jgi:hypothetical protein
MKEIDLPPYAPMLMESTRAIGYSLEASIADLLDNSITAGAANIQIKFMPFESPYISILDDGKGMSREELTNAMRYGSTNPSDERSEHDLGRFGLGLKTASLSQCRKLTVISLKDGVLSGRLWDLDYIKNSKKWSLLEMNTDDLRHKPQVDRLLDNGGGTVVIWEVLDRLNAGEVDLERSMGKKMDLVREHLSLVFHRFLTGEQGLKKIKIYINDDPITPFDPFLQTKSTQVLDDERIIVYGHTVLVRPYILPHLSKMSEEEIKSLGGKDGLRKQQGFYVYRNKRLLVWGTWFRMRRQDDLSKLARVRVDIPNSLDHMWSIDIRKSTAIPPEVVRRNLASIVSQVTNSSKRTWTFRGKKEKDDAVIHIWQRLQTRGGIRYELNRDYSVVDALKKEITPNGVLYLERLLRVIEDGLPLNSLYMDLTNDEKFDEHDEKYDDLINLVQSMISQCESGTQREKLIDEIKRTEPFSHYPEIFNNL